MIDERQCRQAVARLFYNNNKDQRDFDLILELITEHFENREFKEKNFDTVYELYNSLLKDYEKVNKALDKACEELEKLDESHAYECNKQIIEKKGSSTITFGYQTKGEWKEYLLKEVKEDD